MPNYGVMPDQTEAMLTWDWVDARMRSARNFWLCTSCPDGKPHAVPIWGVWVEGNFYFSTGRSSVKARNIRSDNRVVLHLESGDETLIFEGGLVESNEEPALQAAIVRAYVGKYAVDPEAEDLDAIQYRLQPTKVMAWLESDYPATATYWLFDV
jgi:hypothetical protein